jgi:hypothetical protein
MLSLNCKHVQPVEIYIPRNFEVNPITHFGVLVLFSSKFQNFNTFHPLFQKLNFDEKKGNNSKIGNGIYFKIAR